jgi:hypothetical protein
LEVGKEVTGRVERAVEREDADGRNVYRARLVEIHRLKGIRAE